MRSLQSGEVTSQGANVTANLREKGPCSGTAPGKAVAVYEEADEVDVRPPSQESAKPDDRQCRGQVAKMLISPR